MKIISYGNPKPKPIPAPAPIAIAIPDAPQKNVWQGWSLERYPGVQVLIASHNCGPWLKRCLESLDAACRGFSWILIFADDASTDDTRKIVKAYQQITSAEKVVYQKFPKAENVSKAKNQAVKMALEFVDHYQAITFMDADDEAAPGKTEFLLSAAIAGNHLAVKGDFERVPEQGPRTHYPAKTSDYYFGPWSVLIHESLLPRDGNLFCGRWERYEDSLLWSRWEGAGIKIVPVPGQVVHSYYIRAGSVSRPANAHESNVGMAQLRAALRKNVEGMDKPGPVGIVTLLSGRADTLTAWSNWLMGAELPTETSLYVLCNSTDREFITQARASVFGASPRFKSVHFECHGQPYAIKPWEPYLETGRHQHVADLYNQIVPHVAQPFTLFLEDDVLPPLNGIPALFSELTPSTAAVGGAYESANSPGTLCGSLVHHEWWVTPLENFGNDPVDVGFLPGGFTLFRTDALKRCLPMNYYWDKNTSRTLRQNGSHLVIHCGVRCEHNFIRRATEPIPLPATSAISAPPRECSKCRGEKSVLVPKPNCTLRPKRKIKIPCDHCNGSGQEPLTPHSALRTAN